MLFLSADILWFCLFVFFLFFFFFQAEDGIRDGHVTGVQTCALPILVQVGIRDLCPAENQYINAHPQKIRSHHMSTISRSRFQGNSWADYCDEIIDFLPQKVYLSFDIDFLAQYLYPHTGTPVPGEIPSQEQMFL